MNLRDRQFLVLGGTGGIGQALVGLLVAAGARVVLGTRRPEAVPQSEGVSAVFLDLAADDLALQLQQLSAGFPGIDGVIHCAGQNLFASLEQSPAEAIDAQLTVNLRSPMLVARHFAPRFVEAGSGALVFIGSTFGSIGFPGYTAYCASKFGLRGFSEALRRELADTRVQVLYVAPRATATGMNPEVVNQLNRTLGNAVDSPDAVAAQIVRAMIEDRKRRYLGWPERFFVVVNGILPRVVDRAMLKQLPVVRRFLSSGVA